MPWIYILAIVVLIIFLLQSFIIVQGIKNAIVNAFLLLFLLLKDLWKVIRYLYTVLTRSATIRHRYGMGIQLCQAAFRRVCEAIWSIWSFEDRLRSRVLPAADPEPTPEPTPETTPEPTPDQPSGPTRCSGHTDKGQCERKSHVKGNVYYCHHHVLQDPRARK